MKSTNKPARAGAESMERRGEAKGNTEWLRMRRTQCRESVTQRLNRVRQAAKQRKRERFTAYARAGELANLPFPIHPHMLRHSAGYKLANDGHDTRSIQQYLGHRNITHTVRYTELSPERFKGFWKD
jgi:site-specific recombinase XerD